MYYASNTIRKEKNVEYIFDNNIPIYIQLVESIRIQIVSGKLRQGEKLPSVRELALIAKVNPNTMQKALAELESEKLIYTERTNGKFVTTDKKLIENIKKELAIEQVNNYLKNMLDIGITPEEAIFYLQDINYFNEFYSNFNKEKAINLLKDLDLEIDKKISKMSKGMQEKLQLILVMSREAELYILDEPLGGVDPATRDYILDTILTNFKEGASVIISTHLISDIERILDDVIFIDKGKILLTSSADELRNKENGSIDEIFRRYFKC